MNSSNVSFSLHSWNVRGLGDNNKCILVRDVVSSACPKTASFQETKLCNIDHLKVCSFLPANLNEFQYTDADDTRGGILTAWDSSIFSLTSSFTRQHSLMMILSSTASDYSFAVTNVYAPSNHRDSSSFLESLEDIASHASEGWTLAGDFNLTRDSSENNNGTSNANLSY
ncbi:hypothetical protein SETIT_3G049500v2, partial [Setaria italica]